ncbi:MAG: hypothetical protein B2I17_08100 [Thermoplasmatales archaeon B_DKE]|nr:MAG: hypothetical protein B2I17_08100 [Thermoplasmatales archaeon B_DKE]
MHLRKVGYLVIVIGIALAFSGVMVNPNFHSTPSTTFLTPKYTEYKEGFYETPIPSNMTTQTTDIMVGLKSPDNGSPNVSLLVPMKYLSKINSTNIQQYGLNESSNDSADVWFNNVPAGTYALVESQNDSLVVVASPQIPLELGGALTFVGAALIVSGFVITILSVAIRRRNR